MCKSSYIFTKTVAAAAAVKVKGASHGLWISHYAHLQVCEYCYCTFMIVIIYVLTRIVNILGHTMF